MMPGTAPKIPSRIRGNLLSAAAQTVLQTVLLMILYRFLLRVLGAAQFGIWSVVLATSSASRLSELGLTGSVTKYIAKFRASGDDERAAQALETAVISLAIAMGLLLVAVYPVLRWALVHVLPTAARAQGVALLPYAMFSMWVATIGGVWPAALDGCLHTQDRAGIAVAGTLLFVVASFFTVRAFGLQGLACAQIAQALFLTGAGWLAVRRRMPALSAIPNRWNAPLLREMLVYGTSLQVNSLVLFLFEPTTKLLLSRFGDLVSVARFEIAERMVMAVRSVVVEANKVFVPLFATLHEASRDHVTALYTKNLHWLLFIVTPVFSAFVACAPGISEIWFAGYDAPFVKMLVFLSVAWFLNVIGTPAYFAYLGTGRLRWNTTGHVVMGVLNAAMGMSAGRAFGTNGVMVAFSCSLAIGSVIPVCAFHRESHVSAVASVCRSDVVLAAACSLLAATILASYPILTTAADRGTRLAITFGATPILFGAAAWLHPIRQEIRVALSRRIATNP